MQFGVLEIRILEVRILEVRIQKHHVERSRRRAAGDLVDADRHEDVRGGVRIRWRIHERDEERARYARLARDGDHDLRHRQRRHSAFEGAEALELIERGNHAGRRNRAQPIVVLDVSGVVRDDDKGALQAGDALGVVRRRHDEGRPQLRRVDVLVAEADVSRHAHTADGPSTAGVKGACGFRGVPTLRLSAQATWKTGAGRFAVKPVFHAQPRLRAGRSSDPRCRCSRQ